MEDNLEMIEIKWNSKIKMGIVNDYNIVEQMRDNYKIVCEPIGTPAISRKQNKLLIGPYMINKYDLFASLFIRLVPYKIKTEIIIGKQAKRIVGIPFAPPHIE